MLTTANEQWRVVMNEHGACTVNIRKTGTVYKVEEDASGECAAYRGVTCPMSGMVRTAEAAPAMGERTARCKLVVGGKAA